MTNPVSWKIAGLVLVGTILAGCQQTAKVIPPSNTPVEQPLPPVDTTPTPTPIEKPMATGPVDDQGNPVGNTIYFEYDSAVIASGDVTLLGYHAKYLKDAAGKNVLVEGHCDERGTREYNLALGERRAGSVKEVLVGDGVEASRLETVSFGEEKPADAGHDDGAWSKNRRGELIYR